MNEQTVTEIVHLDDDDDEITNENEFPLVIDDDTLFHHEPLDREWTETCDNIYDSHFDVLKHELCSDSSEVLDSPSEVTDLSFERIVSAGKIIRTYIVWDSEEQNENQHGFPGDCTLKLDAPIQYTRVDEPFLVKENGGKTQQSLIAPVVEDGGSISSDDSTEENVKEKQSQNTKTSPIKLLLRRENSNYVIVQPENIKHTKKKRRPNNVNKKLYPCNVCPFKSAYGRVIKSHMRTHTGEKPYVCEFCVYKSTQQGPLERHIKKHHLKHIYSCDCKCSQSVNETTYISQMPYLCVRCGFTCLQPSTLKVHISFHTGKKPRVCENCIL